MGRTLMIRTVKDETTAKQISDYIVGLLGRLKSFRVVVSEPDKPKTTFFEKLGGLKPGWEDEDVLVPKEKVQSEQEKGQGILFTSE